MRKRGFFFSTDALIALVVIILVLLVAFPFLKTTTKESVLQEDTIKVFSSLKVGDIDNSYVQRLIAEKKIREPGRTILEQIGEFYVTNKTIARDLTVEMFEYLNTSENIGIWYNNELLTSKNTSSYEEAKNIETARQVISGISATTVNGSVTGYSARAWLSSILSEKYFYFGGYVGDGNISIMINYSGKIEDIELEIVSNRDFKIYINGKFSGQYENSTSVFSPARYLLGAYNSSFNGSRENIIRLEGVGGNLYVAGGFVKIVYESYEPYQLAKRYSFPGIEGLINIYDGFYVPGQLNALNILLHLNSSSAVFLTIGNKTVFNDSTSGEEIKSIDNSYLSSVLDYSQLSQETIPFRLGLEELQRTLVGANADVVLITDLSGSMDFRLDSDNNGMARACNDINLYNSSTKRISLAKCLDKMVVDIILNASGNRLALSAFYGDDSEPYKGRVYEESLTYNASYLKSKIEVYTPQGGTCICCSINDAYKILNEQSNSSRQKFVIVMSDGIPTHTCQAASGCAGTRTGLPSNEGLWLGWGAGCYGGLDDCEVNDCQCASQNANWSSCRLNNNLNTTVYSIGFGSLSTCTMANNTLNNIASCGKGKYYVSDNATLLKEFYEEIAEEILELSYTEQTIEVSGNISTKLYPDSYIEFNYASDGIPYGLITSVEKQFQNSYFGNFSVPPSLEILETKAVSYSGPRWTVGVEINNKSIYNLGEYGEDYTKLGDPYSINIPNSFVEEENVVKLTTGISPINSSPGSQSNKIVYTTKQNSTSFSEIVAFAEGCNWELEFEDGSMINISVPEGYVGSQHCYYKSSGQEISNSYDATQIAAKNLLQLLDFDDNGRLDVLFTEQNLKISSSEITDIPYLVSTEVQVRRWW